MKPVFIIKGFLFSLLFISLNLTAQQKISMDLGVIRQKAHHNAGLNFSGFWHFDDHLLGGLELNRFFPVQQQISEEDLQFSSWDIEMNFHYLVPLGKTVKFYPVSGIGRCTEKELNKATGQQHSEHFWSLNAGAGMLLELGKWLPHAEYNFTLGRLNQQFLLVGVGYEIEWGHHKGRQEK